MFLRAFDNVDQTGAPARITATRAGNRQVLHTQITGPDGKPLGTAESPLHMHIGNREIPQASKIVNTVTTIIESVKEVVKVAITNWPEIQKVIVQNWPDNQKVTVTNGTPFSPLYTSHSSEVDVMQGRAFVASSGRMAITATQGGNIRLTFSNTSTTRPVVVSAITMVTDINAMSFADVYVNPTANLPVPRLNLIKNAIFAADNANNTSVMLIKGDVSATAMTGQLALQFSVPQYARTVYNQGPIIIQPGVTVGLNLFLKSAGTAEVSIYYREI